VTDASRRRRGRKYPDGCRDAPLVNFVRIEALHLLPDLYETVALSEAVWQEVVVKGEG
jgi:predicted nucleic acid-binding protein